MMRLEGEQFFLYFENRVKYIEGLNYVATGQLWISTCWSDLLYVDDNFASGQSGCWGKKLLWSQDLLLISGKLIKRAYRGQEKKSRSSVPRNKINKKRILVILEEPIQQVLVWWCVPTVSYGGKLCCAHSGGSAGWQLPDSGATQRCGRPHVSPAFLEPAEVSWQVWYICSLARAHHAGDEWEKAHWNLQNNSR